MRGSSGPAQTPTRRNTSRGAGQQPPEVKTLAVVLSANYGRRLDSSVAYSLCSFEAPMAVPLRKLVPSVVPTAYGAAWSSIPHWPGELSGGEWTKSTVRPGKLVPKTENTVLGK